MCFSTTVLFHRFDEDIRWIQRNKLVEINLNEEEKIQNVSLYYKRKHRWNRLGDAPEKSERVIAYLTKCLE